MRKFDESEFGHSMALSSHAKFIVNLLPNPLIKV
jgi:hypothetical protein